jgi:hypothetical protein
LKERNPPAAKVMVNPQSTLLCTMLDITDPNAVFLGQDSKYDIRNDENEDDVVDDENEDVDDDDTEYLHDLFKFFIAVVIGYRGII